MSKIQWTDETWNPIAGCSKVSAGCKNCYAIKDAIRLAENPNPKIAKKYEGTTGFGNWTGKINLASEETLFKPLYWTKSRLIFTNSMSDLFHENVPDEWIDMIFAIMALSPNHTFQILTKRPERMYRYFQNKSSNESPTGLFCPRINHILNVADKISRQAFPNHFKSLTERVASIVEFGCFKNIWLGVSVEDQKSADDRIHWLLRTPAWIRWISAEPLLGRVMLNKLNNPSSRMNAFTGECFNRDDNGNLLSGNDGNIPKLNSLDWVVVGGESGDYARVTNLEFIREIVLACKAEKVPVFVKQMGKWCYDNALWELPHEPLRRTENGRKVHPFFNYRDEKGGNIDQFPTDLRIRQYPI